MVRLERKRAGRAVHLLHACCMQGLMVAETAGEKDVHLGRAPRLLGGEIGQAPGRSHVWPLQRQEGEWTLPRYGLRSGGQHNSENAGLLVPWLLPACLVGVAGVIPHPAQNTEESRAAQGWNCSAEVEAM